MVAKFERNEEGKSEIRMNWGVFMSAIGLLFSATMWIVVKITDIEKNVSLMQQYYVKEIQTHSYEIKDLDMRVRILDAKVQHVDQELDWHIQEVVK